jgi:hypothetical protein
LGLLQPASLAKLTNIEVRNADIDARVELQPYLSVSDA